MKIIHVTTRTNLKKFNKLCRNNDVFVDYYATWCGHCKMLDPIWAELEKKVSHIDGVLAKVESEFIKKIKCYNDIEGYPTILSLKNGEIDEMYSGERTVDGFLEYNNEHFDGKIKTPRRRKRRGKTRRKRRRKRRGKTRRRRRKYFKNK